MNHKYRLFAVAAPLLISAVAANAADLYQPPAEAAPPVYAPASAYNWTGLYAGIHGGWGWGDTTASTSSAFNMGIDGGLFGGQIGYNYMLPSSIVLGVEGDLSWSGLSGSVTSGPTVTQDLDWVGTVRGRLGYAMGNFMPYVTGGFAFGGGTRTTNIGPQSASATHTGYALGVGAEWAFAPQWTAKLEYQYVNLSGSTYGFTFPPPSPSVGITASTVRVGLNYKF